MMDVVTHLTTEELRRLKKEIEAELSKRHKAKEDEKCNCWTCSHCWHDENAHPSRRCDRDGFKCMAWSKKGRVIPTKHKAPSWCPKGFIDDFHRKQEDSVRAAAKSAQTIGDAYDSLPVIDKYLIAGVINGDIEFSYFQEFNKDPEKWRKILEQKLLKKNPDKWKPIILGELKGDTE